MVTKANYAVVGDMHEVLPALLEELGSTPLASLLTAGR